MRFIPPLIVSSQQIDEGMEILGASVKAAERRVAN
jgi:4-aminobutyrate aminotransferase-like enzyme